jgi:hypothetical protein
MDHGDCTRDCNDEQCCMGLHSHTITQCPALLSIRAYWLLSIFRVCALMSQGGQCMRRPSASSLVTGWVSAWGLGEGAMSAQRGCGCRLPDRRAVEQAPRVYAGQHNKHRCALCRCPIAACSRPAPCLALGGQGQVSSWRPLPACLPGGAAQVTITTRPDVQASASVLPITYPEFTEMAERGGWGGGLRACSWDMLSGTGLVGTRQHVPAGQLRDPDVTACARYTPALQLRRLSALAQCRHAGLASLA